MLVSSCTAQQVNNVAAPYHARFQKVLLTAIPPYDVSDPAIL